MLLRSSLGCSVMVFTCGFGVVACGDSGSSTPTPTDGTGTMTSTGPSSTMTSTSTTTTMTTSTSSTTAPTTETTDGSSGQTSETESTGVIPVCEIPSFSVFTRSDTDASWDDNDFSSVTIDASQCPPAVYVDATWPHEEGWQNADPSEANHEQTRFTLDAYGAGDLTNKEIIATIELVDDQRGPAATAGGYLVSVASVSTFDRVVELEPVVVADAGAADGGVETMPQTVTETGYTEAETPEPERILLRHVGDRATVRLALPSKTAAVDSYDPARAIKVNLRFYNVYEGLGPVVEVPVAEAPDAGADAAVDASLPVVEGDPSLVYDYLTSRFAITRFSIVDVGTPAP